MPLRDGIQVILQYPLANGGAVCRAFGGLPIAHSAYFCLYPLDASDVAACEQIGDEIAARLCQLGASAAELRPPCGGNSYGGCHALQEADCMKVLLPVIGNQAPVAAPSICLTWLNGDDTFIQATVFLNSTSFNVLPTEIKSLNGISWSKSDSLAISDILKLAHIISQRPRVFLSYVRADSKELAEQLFEELPKVGFEVFLDRFSVAPAADFQHRLTEELSRVGTVLLIESINTPNSQWVRYEIDFARINRLGLFALSLSGAPATSGIAVEHRISLSNTDVGGDGRLASTRLKHVLNSIIQGHTIAERRRIAYLRDTLSNALSMAGFSNQAFSSAGVVLAKKSKDYAIRISHLPPEIGDFHSLENYKSPFNPIVFAPAKYMDWRARRPIEWLSDISSIALHDEADLLDAIRRLS